MAAVRGTAVTGLRRPGWRRGTDRFPSPGMAVPTQRSLWQVSCRATDPLWKRRSLNMSVIWKRRSLNMSVNQSPAAAVARVRQQSTGTRSPLKDRAPVSRTYAADPERLLPTNTCERPVAATRAGWHRDGSAPPSRFDCSDVDLSHLHHGFERAFSCRLIWIGDRGHQGAWRDLPRRPPLALAPAACAFLATVADNCDP